MVFADLQITLMSLCSAYRWFQFQTTKYFYYMLLSGVQGQRDLAGQPFLERHSFPCPEGPRASKDMHLKLVYICFIVRDLLVNRVVLKEKR